MIQEESQMLQFFLMPFELEDLPYVINEGIIFVDKFQLRNALAATFPTATNYSNLHFNRFLKTHGCDIYEGYVDLASYEMQLVNGDRLRISSLNYINWS